MITSLTQRPIRTLTALALLAATPLVLVACSTTAPDPSPSATAQAGVGATWGACMRDAGFDVPDPSDAEAASGLVRTPPGGDAEAFSTQASTCSDRAGIARHDAAQHQEWAEQNDRMTSCVRENGFEDFPEQRPGSFDATGYARVEDPAFEAALRRCQEEIAPDIQRLPVG